MTLKEIYTWIEDRFPYFRQVAKPGWKVPPKTLSHHDETGLETNRVVPNLSLQNSIRHNLSLHDMFIREMSLDGKISYWTIRPEANRCITLDQVCKVSSTFGLCSTFQPQDAVSALGYQ